MARALTPFRRIQISNEEGTPGTPEAATEILFGTISPRYGDKIMFYPEEERNLISRNLADDFIVQREAGLQFEGEMNERHIVWAAMNCIAGNITPTQPDATNEPLHYLWSIAPSLATTPNTPDIAAGIDTYTMEFGDNVQAYEADYCFGTSLEISGGVNEPVKMVWEMTGQQLTETTFTGALTAVAAQRFPFNLAKFYIDSSYANMGNTQVTDMLMAFRWRLETMFTARYAADGGLVFSGVNEERKKVELELSYYRDGTNSEGEKDKYDARSTAYLRVELDAPNEMDSAQSNPPMVLLDGAYRYTDWPEADDEDGHVVEKVTAESVYDSTAAKEYEMLIHTTLAALP